ncbi:formate dehydrogenase [Bordetella genomosp. 9]|uniref:formate dehydrogenase subunit delta n=1 Tax=Bordetella genomosp. 9 TaxID=1416803 RepID=UPI000A294BF5|nr:formate dehydrogenase subunit delta [Bordetella genomosp. 9]ARP91806.1 formate dehydrogenase [Bordetella genomosp. 9]
MDIGNLIRMANRIGDFFDAMPDREEAIDNVAGHIRKFWEPRMRAALLDFLSRQPDGMLGETRLSPIVLEAVARHREALTPKTAVH